jgi:hypothetical protein
VGLRNLDEHLDGVLQAVRSGKRYRVVRYTRWAVQYTAGGTDVRCAAAAASRQRSKAWLEASLSSRQNNTLRRHSRPSSCSNAATRHSPRAQQTQATLFLQRPQLPLLYSPAAVHSRLKPPTHGITAPATHTPTWALLSSPSLSARPMQDSRAGSVACKREREGKQGCGSLSACGWEGKEGSKASG